MPEQPETKRRWYGHPFLIGGLVLLLFADIVSISSDVWANSTVKHDILGFQHTLSTAHGRPIPGVGVRTKTGIAWVWPTDEEYAKHTAGLFGGDRMYAGIFRDMIRQRGVYHPTRRVESYKVWPDGISDKDQSAIVDAVLVAIDRDPSYEAWMLFVPDMLRAGVTTRSFPIYSGYARNALAVLMWLALIVCCTRGKPWQWFREPRLGFYSKYSLSERRQMRNQCVKCGYDLAGLDGKTCPECGSQRQARAEATNPEP